MRRAAAPDSRYNVSTKPEPGLFRPGSEKKAAMTATTSFKKALPALVAAGALSLAAIHWPGPALGQIQTQLPSVVDTVEQGYLAHRRGDYEGAIEYYTGIIRRRGLSVKERAVSYLLRGEAKRDAGQLEESVLDFTRALNQWPNYPQAIFFRGQVLASLDKLHEAYADLSRAVELDPDRESYHTNLALLKKKMASLGIIPDETFVPPEYDVSMD
jgi:tetratricopeptide (TPR) repeat protein